MADLPTGTVTFLFSDIEGSTRLLGELGDRYADALAEHRRMVREAVARHGGVEVDTQGDAFFIAFSSASDALAAAKDAQRTLSLPVRMGVHTGEAEVTEEGYVGLEVHRAARICGAAHGGQVVLSEHSLVDGIAVRDLGLHRLKDLGERVRLFQLGEREFPPLRSLNATNLPAQPNPLVGRERELREVIVLVHENRLVTLSGPGGTGKTRLALQAAAELVDDFPDGVFWVPLAPIVDPELVEPTIAQTIGAQDGLAEHVEEKQMLLLLDNLEQVLDAAPRLSELLAYCPNLHLLSTSRALLRIAGERDYPVEPLSEDDAVVLFRQRAAVAEPVEVVDEICRKLDGLPLAIELAAARTGLLPPAELLERLERRLPMLTGGRRDAPERQRTLRATIEWSYDLLSAAEQALFRRLSVFAGSFTIDAAEQVCDANLETLESLLEKSLIRRWASGRLGMLETVGEYALERLEQVDDARPWHRRQADYFLGVAQEGASRAYDRRDALDRFAAEIHNVRAALKWALAASEASLGLELAAATRPYWSVRGGIDEARRWFSEILERDIDLPPRERARAYSQAAYIFEVSGDWKRAKQYYEETLRLYEEIGEIEPGARVLTLMRAQRDDEALVLAHEVGDDRLLGRTLLGVGEHLRDRGRLAQAAEKLEHALELVRRCGDSLFEAGTLQALGDVALALGDLDTADERYRDGLRASHDFGHAVNAATCLAGLATVAARRGDLRRAGALCGVIEAAGDLLAPVDRRRYEPVLAPLAEEAEFAAGLTEGRQAQFEYQVELLLADVDSTP
jgi:predicted ATPase